MKIKAVHGKYTEYILSKIDEEFGSEGNPTFVTVRLASPSDNLSRFHSLHQHLFNLDELKSEEIFLTLASCNIIGEDNTSPLFRFNKDGYLTRDEFTKSMRQLPPEWIDEIHECVLDANPSWAKELEEIQQINEYRINSFINLLALRSMIEKYEPNAEVHITLKIRIDNDEITWNPQ